MDDREIHKIIQAAEAKHRRERQNWLWGCVVWILAVAFLLWLRFYLR